MGGTGSWPTEHKNIDYVRSPRGSAIRVSFVRRAHLPNHIGTIQRILLYERKVRPGPIEGGNWMSEISVTSEGFWALRFSFSLKGVIIYQGGSESTRAARYTNAMDRWVRSMGELALDCTKSSIMPDGPRAIGIMCSLWGVGIY